MQRCMEQICSPVCANRRLFYFFLGGGASPLLIFSVPASFLPVIFHLHTSLKCVITRQLPGVNANMQPFLFLQRHTFFFLTANILCFFLFFFFCSCLDCRSFLQNLWNHSTEHLVYSNSESCGICRHEPQRCYHFLNAAIQTGTVWETGVSHL